MCYLFILFQGDVLTLNSRLLAYLMKNSFLFIILALNTSLFKLFLKGAPFCEFLELAELFPEVQSGYYTVEGVEEEFLWEKGDKHGKGDRIPCMLCNIQYYIQYFATSAWLIRLNGYHVTDYFTSRN